MSYSNNFTFYYDLTYDYFLYKEAEILYNWDGDYKSFLASPITVEENPEMFNMIKTYEKNKRTSAQLKKSDYKELFNIFNDTNILVNTLMLTKILMKKIQENGISFTRSKPYRNSTIKMLEVNFNYKIQIDEKFTPESYKLEVDKIFEKYQLCLQKVDAKEDSFEFLNHSLNSMLKLFSILFDLKLIHNKINNNLILDNLQDMMNSISKICEEYLYFNMCLHEMHISLGRKEDKYLNKLDISILTFNLNCSINCNISNK